eukprot:scaffold549_cov117-Isochrysis_galbana.AAC.2
MAPLQLRLEPTEVVLATNKGAARARVDSTDESSPQNPTFLLTTGSLAPASSAWLAPAASASGPTSPLSPLALSSGAP